MHATDIVAYDYDADIYCSLECCARAAALDASLSAAEIELAFARTARVENLEDESAYDSSDAPKVVFCGYETDSPDHCAQCRELIDGQQLTPDGYNYVADALASFVESESRDGNASVLSAWLDMFPEAIDGCPSCGNAIDYCPGHGEIGDPYGNETLRLHDDDIHNVCSPYACYDRVRSALDAHLARS